MATMEQIEKLAQRYARERAALANAVGTCEGELVAVKRKHLARIKSHAGTTAEALEALQVAVGDSENLFRRPKSRLLHGIRVGFRKAAGKVSFADGAKVVALIRKHMPDRFDDLVRVTETPFKPGLEGLSGAELKRLGVTVSEDTDEAFVKAADGEIDKLVNALLDSAEAVDEAADKASTEAA